METKGTTQLQRKPAAILTQQSTHLQRSCACGQHTLAGGECDACRKSHATGGEHAAVVPIPTAPTSSFTENQNDAPADLVSSSESRFAHDFSQIAVHTASTSKPTIQAKLEVNGSKDVSEQEADEVAEQVTHSPLIEPDSPRRTSLPAPIAHETSDMLHALKQRPAMPLSQRVRQRVEPVFRVDLSNVQVHTDTTAHTAAKALRAKAFTHDNHIWLGTNQSADSLELMAHEATHVVQQSANPTLQSAVQTKSTDQQTISNDDDIEISVQQQIQQALQPPSTQGEIAVTPAALGKETADASFEPDAQKVINDVKPADVKQQQQALQTTQLPSDEQNQQVKPQVEQAAQKVKEQVDLSSEHNEAPQEQVSQKTVAQGTTDSKGPVDQAQQASSMVEDALADVEVPALEQGVDTLSFGALNSPVDAMGEPLSTDPQMDAQAEDLAQQAQTLRTQGQRIQVAATTEKANAKILRGNITLMQQQIGQAEQGVQTSLDHIGVRRDALGKAQQALSISEQKAQMVAKEAPGYSTKADEGKQKSGPIASDAAKLTAENKAKTPTDPEAAGKSREQGDKLNKVNSDTTTVDDTISQAKERAGTLAQDAAKANQMNSATRTKIDSMQSTLQQSDQRLAEMRQQSTQATNEVEQAKSQPDTMMTQATTLDRQGTSLIHAASDIEQRLQQSQTRYMQSLQTVPGISAASASSSTEDISQVPETEDAPLLQTEPALSTSLQSDSPDQAAADVLPATENQPPAQPSNTEGGDYAKREHINLAEKLPSWLTGEGPEANAQPGQEQEERAKAIAQKEQQRKDDLALINTAAKGNFTNLGAATKARLALQLSGQKIYRSISSTQWPGWGKLAKGLVDPRAPLAGVLSGLSMIVSAGANIFSKEQWSRDPLGNALKSAADIATGLTIILGSITALALLIITLLGAITIVTVGAAAPVTGPIIGFCGTVVTTVGGWTIVVGKIALILQALVFIKNLIDAATAQTAEDLSGKSDDLKEDIGNAGNVLMQIGMAKLSQAGGKALLSEIEEEGGAVAYASKMPSKFAQRVKSLPGRIVGGVKALPRRVVTGARSIGRGIKAVGSKGVGAVKSGVGRVRNAIRSLGSEGEIIEGSALATREASGAVTAAEDVARLGKMTPETAEMLEKNPALREALVENPEAADLFKLCHSLCFPGSATREQIQRLQQLVRDIRKAGGKLDRAAVKDFLYANRENLNEAIDTLEMFGLTDLPNPKQAAQVREIVKRIEERGIDVNRSTIRKFLRSEGHESLDDAISMMNEKFEARFAEPGDLPSQIKKDQQEAALQGDPLLEVPEYEDIRVGQPTETPEGDLAPPGRGERFAAGNRFNEIGRAKYPYNEIPLRTRSGRRVFLDSYNPTTGEIVSRKFTQLGEIDPLQALDYVQELRVKYPSGATILKSRAMRKLGLAGKELEGYMILEVPVQRSPIPKDVLDYARSRGITIRDITGNEYH